ncbi:GntR family transcriptional regulator [Clostridium aciditolerans]|jgi:GntR family transcriptional regulator|uniref:GntR family transcriptional regulator n=1 Tax=Clostridium aciditolerans TaxID=339861 RepID=A0A934HUH7_9CLOT|nr:GntR family transcriptional regulator [Clostridium aciditolerans]MBI6871103.1 GntR family transcriptional regulator [Clostridium aciditolerans]
MLLKINFESDVPIYAQLKNQIIRGIAKGELDEGESLPSVRQMAEDIGINMHTVNKAYNLLKGDGFITIDRRKGAIVNKIPIPSSEEYDDILKEELESIISEAHCRGVSEEDFIEACKEIYSVYKRK